MTTTNDEKPRDLVYDVTYVPLYGKIVKKIASNMTNQTSGAVNWVERM